jgi:hypothetical protein
MVIKKFNCIREHVRPVQVNIVPADSHVGEIERSIRTIKERLRACVHGLPFKRLPKLFLTHMVYDAVSCLNMFPWANGISALLSPTSIVTGLPPPDFLHMRIEFGSYAQVFEDNNPTNTPRARTLGAIALNPTGNAQGDFFFMSLATGARISRHNWTELPITDTAIARVEALAFQDEQPLIQARGLVVEWRHDQPIDDYEYDRDFIPPPDGAPDTLLTFDPLDATELFDLVADDPFFVPPPVPPVLAQGANVVPPNPTVPLVQQNAPPPVPPVPPVPAPANETAEDNGAFDDDYNADDAHEAQYDDDAEDDEAQYDDEAEDEGAYGDAANNNELGATIDAAFDELGAAADTVQPDR